MTSRGSSSIALVLALGAVAWGGEEQVLADFEGPLSHSWSGSGELRAQAGPAPEGAAGPSGRGVRLRAGPGAVFRSKGEAVTPLRIAHHHVAMPEHVMKYAA